MRSIIGQCPDCCDCPTPTVQWDSRSASKTKCGFPNNTGYPTARYRSRTWTGFHRDSINSAPDCAAESGFCRFDYAGSNDYDEDCVCSGNITATSSMDSTNCTPGTVINFGCGEPFTWGSAVVVTVTSSTVTTAAGDGICYDQGLYASKLTGTVTETKSDEYTTIQLVSNTEAALPAFDDDWNDTAGSLRELTSNQLTYSIRDSRYRFTFPIPRSGVGTCYKIEWIERFTPEEGDPVDTPMCMIWDGVTPEGYDPADSDTWPVIGDGTNDYFELPPPEENGETTVVEVVAKCRGCEEGCPE